MIDQRNDSCIAKLFIIGFGLAFSALSVRMDGLRRIAVILGAADLGFRKAEILSIHNAEFIYYRKSG